MFIFLDTETTGNGFDDKLCQIAFKPEGGPAVSGIFNPGIHIHPKNCRSKSIRYNPENRNPLHAVPKIYAQHGTFRKEVGYVEINFDCSVLFGMVCTV